jgi:hypothetical protein
LGLCAPPLLPTCWNLISLMMLMLENQLPRLRQRLLLLLLLQHFQKHHQH